MELENVLLLVRDARSAIESGRAEDAAWLLEAAEDGLVASVVCRVPALTQ
jgi:hypothetical protein